MRRKLINYEAFERIQQESLSAAESELVDSADILAAALGVDGLNLDCYGESNVVFETTGGTYVRADYSLKNEHLVLENIEELVIDTDSADRKGRTTVAEMIDALLNKESSKAEQLFETYMTLPSVRRTLTEGRKPGFIRDKSEAKAAGKSKSKNAKEKAGFFKSRKRKLDSVTDPNTHDRAKRGSLSFGSAKGGDYQKKYQKARKAKHVPRKVLDAKGNVKIRRTMKEWAVLSENVTNYVAYQHTGPALEESQVRHDDHGNVVAIRIPSRRLRNESLVQKSNYKTLKTDCKSLRESAHGLARDEHFCKAVLSIKRHNALSDDAALQESLETLIGRYPNVLYLTQEELAGVIAEALNVAGATNYDDTVCTFLSEGILRTAHGVFGDRVEKILRLAQADVGESEDPYLEFQTVVGQFYPSLDESFALEMRVFSDLLEAVNQVRTIGERGGDDELAGAAAEYLEGLHAICSGESEASLDFAEEVAEWLQSLVEFNANSKAHGWDGEFAVTSKAHTTVNGEHPRMGDIAREKVYSPADMGSGSGDPAPQLGDDGKFNAAKNARNNSWGNQAGEDTYPSLKNPYVPKSFGDYTMRAEKGVDKDWKNGLNMVDGKDVWPDLKNPYIPKPYGDYRMKPGAETDLVVDK